MKFDILSWKFTSTKKKKKEIFITKKTEIKKSQCHYYINFFSELAYTYLLLTSIIQII